MIELTESGQNNDSARKNHNPFQEWSKITINQSVLAVPLIWKPGDLILGIYEVRPVYAGGVLDGPEKDHHRGSYGLINRIYHRTWKREMAVKTPQSLKYKTPDERAFFIAECETWINLSLHPHITTCYYVHELGGVPRIFTEYADAGSLGDRIRSGLLYRGGKEYALQAIFDYAIQYAYGLDFAHRQNIIHQDVKPDNALLWADGTLKVTDFGLARTLFKIGTGRKTDNATALQQANNGGFTPQYCSPEQASGERLTLRSDIWSWAVSLLEMFTGSVTWRAGFLADEELNHYHLYGHTRPDLDALMPDMPEGVSDLLQFCLQHDPIDRPESMAECAEILKKSYHTFTGEDYPRPWPRAIGETSDLFNNKGLSMFDLGKYQEGEVFLNKALELNHGHYEALYNRTLFRWRSGKINDLAACAELSQIKENQPAIKAVNEGLGWFYFESGRYEEAVEYFSLALRPSLKTGASPDLKIALQRAQDSAVDNSKIFCGHQDKIYKVVFSPDGRFAASGGADCLVKIWDLDAGECLLTFKKHSAGIGALAFSTDGTKLISGSYDCTIMIWDLVKGEPLTLIEDLPEGVSVVAVAPGGAQFLSGGSNTLFLWEIETGELLRTYREGSAGSLAFSPDGRHFLTGCYNYLLRLWQMECEHSLHMYQGHRDIVNCVDYSPDGIYALSGSGDYTCKIWKPGDRGGPICTINDPGEVINSVHFSPDGRFFWQGSGSGRSIKLFEFPSLRCLRTFESNHYKALFSPSQLQAIFYGSDESFELRDIRALTEGSCSAPFLYAVTDDSKKLQDSEDVYRTKLIKAEAALASGKVSVAQDLIDQARSVSGYANSKESMDLLTRAGSYSQIRSFRRMWPKSAFERPPEAIYNLMIYEEKRQVFYNPNYINCLLFSADGRMIIAGFEDRRIMRVELPDGTWELIYRLPDSVLAMTLSPDGDYLLCGSNDPIIFLIESRTGRDRQLFVGSEGLLSALAYSPDGRTILSANEEGNVYLWDVNTGRCKHIFTSTGSRVSTLAYRPDGREILIVRDSDKIEQWSLIDYSCIRVFKTQGSSLIDLALLPKGHAFLVASADRNLNLWDLKTEACLHTHLLRGDDEMTAFALSPNGRFVLAGDDSGMVRLHDLDKETCLSTWQGHADTVNTVAFAPNSRYAFSTAIDQTMKLWEFDWEYSFPGWSGWDDGAEIYLKNFLDRQGYVWQEQDFSLLMAELSRYGYGWLRPEGVKKQLRKMSAKKEL
jgi:WD40 repeat protein/serine/threonine protein kinase